VSKSLRDLVNCPDSPAPLGMSRNSRTQQRLRRSLRPDVRVARCASLRPRLLPTGNVSGVLRQVSRLDSGQYGLGLALRVHEGSQRTKGGALPEPPVAVAS